MSRLARWGGAAGAAGGTLVGLLVGLSGSPVVGAFLGTLSTGLLALLGLRAEKPEPSLPENPGEQKNDAHAHGHRERTTTFLVFTSFALCSAVAVLLGLYARTHDLLSPSPRAQVQRWLDAGYDAASARYIVAAQFGGSLVKADEKGLPAQPSDPKSSPLSTLLFAGSARDCDNIDATHLKGANALLKAFRDEGGSWKSIAEEAERLPLEEQRGFLVNVWHIACK